jgi:hypothetical protein
MGAMPTGEVVPGMEGGRHVAGSTAHRPVHQHSISQTRPTDVSAGERTFLVPCLTLTRENAPQRHHSLREPFDGLRVIPRVRPREVIRIGESRYAHPGAIIIDSLTPPVCWLHRHDAMGVAGAWCQAPGRSAAGATTPSRWRMPR